MTNQRLGEIVDLDSLVYALNMIIPHLKPDDPFTANRDRLAYSFTTKEDETELKITLYSSDPDHADVGYPHATKVLYAHLLNEDIPYVKFVKELSLLSPGRLVCALKTCDDFYYEEGIGRFIVRWSYPGGNFMEIIPPELSFRSRPVAKIIQLDGGFVNAIPSESDYFAELAKYYQSITFKEENGEAIGENIRFPLKINTKEKFQSLVNSDHGLKYLVELYNQLATRHEPPAKATTGESFDDEPSVHGVIYYPSGKPL